MTIEIVDLRMKNGWIFHSYVNVYQAGYPISDSNDPTISVLFGPGPHFWCYQVLNEIHPRML